MPDAFIFSKTAFIKSLGILTDLVLATTNVHILKGNHYLAGAARAVGRLADDRYLAWKAGVYRNAET